MTPNEFPEWLTTARDQKAARVLVRRVQKLGTKASPAALMLDLEVKGCDVPRALERMRDDIRSRHLTHGSFDVQAVTDKGEVVLVDRVTITRDDAIPDGPATELEPGVQLARMVLDQSDKAYTLVRDMAGAQKDFVVACTAAMVAGSERERLMHSEFFDMMMLKNEREAEQTASKDRREIAKGAFETLGPIAGSIASHVMKNATPAWAAFAQKLLANPERFHAIVSTLDPEEIIALETALGFTFPKPAGAPAAEAPPAPAAEPAPAPDPEPAPAATSSTSTRSKATRKGRRS